MFRKALLTTAAAFAVFALGSVARADSFNIVGNSTGSLSTAAINSSFNAATNTYTFTITNTSPFDARVTGIGFDLHSADFSGNSSSGINGFSGSNVAAFTFGDGSLGNVPQFNSAVLDFGFTTSNNGAFTNGSPNSGLAPGSSLTFSVSSSAFAGMTQAQIAGAIYVRFQRVGANGEGSDVGRVTDTPGSVPEPMTMVLFGTGLAGVAARARRRRNVKA
jgi:hypothetical protein